MAGVLQRVTNLSAFLLSKTSNFFRAKNWEESPLSLMPPASEASQGVGSLGKYQPESLMPSASEASQPWEVLASPGNVHYRQRG